MVAGICPFADDLVDQSKLIGWLPGHFDRVGFCDHTAGGYYGTLTRPSFWNDPNGNGSTDDAISVHFGIAQTGRIVQVLNIFDTAFAQGRLGWPITSPLYDRMGQRSPNVYLISTEHEDKQVTNYQWSEEMYQSDLRIKRWCVEEVLRVTGKDIMRFGIDSLTGHHMFDPVNRKYCPGTGWPRERLYTDLALGDDMFVRMNGIANPAYWNNHLVNDTQGWGIRADYGLPLEAKSVEVEVFLKTGRLDFFDGGSENRAGFHEGPGVNHFRILLDNNGTAYMKGENAIVDKLMLLGYYT